MPVHPFTDAPKHARRKGTVNSLKLQAVSFCGIPEKEIDALFEKYGVKPQSFGNKHWNVILRLVEAAFNGGEAKGIRKGHWIGREEVETEIDTKALQEAIGTAVDKEFGKFRQAVFKAKIAAHRKAHPNGLFPPR